ncbi:MAG: DUF928 domain-containing protein [Gammaproteobacteria bacterium]|nr:DUF928 domain-containing protein [Gammaproteobacteria bacterium]
MKKVTISAFRGFAQTLATAVLLSAGSGTAIAQDAPTYNPPRTGMPSQRAGAGTRGSGRDKVSALSVLAPEHIGHVIAAQPTLYWWTPNVPNRPVKFTLVKAKQQSPEDTIPLMEETMKISKAGILPLRLADYNVTLKEDVDYEWSVAIMSSPKRRSRGAMAIGAIKRVEPPSWLSTRLASVLPRQQPDLYARAGLWYDAIDSISQLIAAHPDDEWLKKARISLLEQVNLPQVAAFDK